MAEIAEETRSRILEMVADGASNRQIAATLGITWRTIKRVAPDAGWTLSEGGKFARNKQRQEKKMREVWNWHPYF